MNYRHSYHAGNFADVIKHIVLITVLQALQRKETPLCFLDTHAGIGLYELFSVEAQKKQEYENGISKLFASDDKDTPPEIKKYCSIVKKYNSDNALHLYPGSPIIAEEILRPQDQMILCELHPDDCESLKINMGRNQHCAIHHNNGYFAMKAFLPPKQKRGLVLIDPPFEKRDEFEQLYNSLHHALKHWRGGHFMIWYPIKDEAAVEDFYRQIQMLATESIAIHFSLNENIEFGKLSSCGILLINPPWQVKETLEDKVLPHLAATLDASFEIMTLSH